MKTSDPISIKGRPSIYVRDRAGNIVTEHHLKNLVVEIGKKTLVRMLSGDHTARIKSVELGTGGTSDGVFSVVPPSPSDVALASPMTPSLDKDVVGFEYKGGPPENQVDFYAVFDSYEVDEIVSEAVLKFDDGSILARFTFPSVYLRADEGFSLEIVWSIIFS